MVVPAQHTSRSACRAAFVASACARVVRCHDAKQRVADRAGCIALRPAPCAPTAPWVACVYRARLASRSDRTHRGPSRPNRPRRPHAPDGPEGFGRCPSGTFRAQAVCDSGRAKAHRDQMGPGIPNKVPPRTLAESSLAACPGTMGSRPSLRAVRGATANLAIVGRNSRPRNTRASPPPLRIGRW